MQVRHPNKEVAAGRRWCLPVDSVDAEEGDMKMIRWFLGFVSLLILVCLLIFSPPIRAATAYSPLTDCDEHPWDFLKYAYKVEVLVVSADYVLFAVWYTKEQIQPTIIRVDLRSESAGNGKTRAKSSYIFTE